MLAAVLALMLQQTATGQVVWNEPAPPPAAVAPAAPTTHNLPDWARADPFGYERSECSPLIRKADETQEACQARVRIELASDLGGALPAALRPAAAPDSCRQEAAGDRYAVQCGAPTRNAAPTVALEEQTCDTRPQVQPQGGVAWTQECRPASGVRREDQGLKIHLGGRD